MAKVLSDVGVKVVGGALASLILIVGSLIGPGTKTILGLPIHIPLGAVLAVLVLVFGISWYLFRMRPKPIPHGAETFGAMLTEEEILKRIQIGVSGDGDGIGFWKSGPDSSVRIWLSVRNHCPFGIEIDRIIGKVVVGVQICDLTHLKREKVAAHSEKQIFVECPLSSEALQKIDFQRKQQRDPEIGLELTAYAGTPSLTVAVIRAPRTGNYRFFNFDLTKP
jgi:hypothetical protein